LLAQSEEVNTEWRGYVHLFGWFICRKLLKEREINFTFSVTFWSRDSAVDIEIDYGLDDQGLGIRVPEGARFFSSHHRPDHF
jgi:hypothetical protein